MVLKGRTFDNPKGFCKVSGPMDARVIRYVILSIEKINIEE